MFPHWKNERIRMCICLTTPTWNVYITDHKKIMKCMPRGCWKTGLTLFITIVERILWHFFLLNAQNQIDVKNLNAQVIGYNLIYLSHAPLQGVNAATENCVYKTSNYCNWNIKTRSDRANSVQYREKKKIFLKCKWLNIFVSDRKKELPFIMWN